MFHCNTCKTVSQQAISISHLFARDPAIIGTVLLCFSDDLSQTGDKDQRDVFLPGSEPPSWDQSAHLPLGPALLSGRP